MTRQLSFFKNHKQNEAKRIVPELFFIKKKVLFEVTASGPQPSLNSPLLGIQ